MILNKKCLALTEEQYRQSVTLLRNGFFLDDRKAKPNERIATIAVAQASLGLRLGDVLRLKLSTFVKDGNRWRLDFKEQKTNKSREFTVPVEVYSFIQDYAVNRGIGRDEKLFDISERQVERHLNKVFQRMSLPLHQYGSHSYRKFFSMKVYTENNFNIELVRILLQHSSVQITQKYLSISQKMVEDALTKTAAHVV